MKRKHTTVFFICALALTLGYSPIYAQNFRVAQTKANIATEGYAFGELVSSYSVGSWSFVINQSNEFLTRYPFSVHRNEVLLYKGESLFFLGQLNDALVIFEILVSDENTSGKKAEYWMGRILSFQGEHSRALEHLYRLVEKPFDDAQLNKDVLLYSARSLSVLNRHTELIAVIEYYIKNYATGSTPPEIIPLLGNLWIGMGIEAFEQHKLEEAQEYFHRADLQKIAGQNISSQLELSGLYQAIIHYVQGNPLETIKILESRMLDGGDLELEYLSFLGQLYGEAEQWYTCEKYSAAAWDIATTSEKFSDTEATITSTTLSFLKEAAYWYAVCLFRRGIYAETAQVLGELEQISANFIGGKSSLENSIQLLYAQSLYLSGSTQKALTIFTDLFSDSSETAKALFLSGRWTQAAEVSRLSGDTYIEGLAAFQTKDWALAEKLLLDTDVQGSSVDESWKLYYGALAQYHMGEYSSCYRTMEEFLEVASLHRYVWDGYMVSAMCAIQQGQIENALEKSLAGVQSALTQEQRHASIVFAAELYIEQKQYVLATMLLKEFSVVYNTGSIGPRLLLVQSYAALGELNAADSELKKIIELFPDELQAREASFKRGELQFKSGNYDEAEQLFRAFRLDIPIGTYSDTALYYEAQARQKQDDINGALLLYTDLIKRYPNSSYRFISLSHLIALYREENEYANALQTALQTKEEYPLEFSTVNLNLQIEELEALVAGTDEQLVETTFRWQRAAKNTTAEGRKIALELANLYLASSDQIDAAHEILVDLDSLLTSNNGEATLHGEVLEKLGKIERGRENCLEAARYYLKAAERITFAGGTQANELSAKVLYGAVEAFDCARKIADANVVYARMNTDYKDSIWTDRARSLLGID